MIKKDIHYVYSLDKPLNTLNSIRFNVVSPKTQIF